MAISGGIDWTSVQAALHSWVVWCTGLAADHVVWGQQQAPRPTQAGIIMRLMMLDDTHRPWVDIQENPFVIPTMTITSVDDTDNTLTKSAHGLLTGDGPVQLASTGVLPSGLDPATNYWIVKVNANTFKLADSFVNSMNNVTLDLADTGTGIITLDDTPATRRVGKEVLHLQRSLQRAVLTLECYTNDGVGMDMATSILWRVAAKRLLPTAFSILDDAHIGVTDMDRVRSMGGTQGQYLYEPRAMLDIYLCLPSEDSEASGTIERTEITRLDPDDGSAIDTFTIDVDS